LTSNHILEDEKKDECTQQKKKKNYRERERDIEFVCMLERSSDEGRMEEV
jgi:hypothetical protein